MSQTILKVEGIRNDGNKDKNEDLKKKKKHLEETDGTIK